MSKHLLRTAFLSGVKLLLFTTLLYGLFACRKSDTCEACIDNVIPSAIAGRDTLYQGIPTSLKLDGSGSYDPDGSIISYHWIKLSGPFAILADENSSIATLNNISPGTFRFVLTVTDNLDAIDKDTIRITINLTGGTNAPVANAGADKLIQFPTNSVMLDASSSFDLDNDLQQYIWKKVSGPLGGDPMSPNAIQTNVGFTLAGPYQYELEVIDSRNQSDRDTINVVVIDPTISGSCTTRPIINATLMAIGNLSIPRLGVKMAAAGNKVLFAGGYVNGGTSTRVDILDIVSNSWQTAELRTHGQRDAFVSVSSGDKVFFAGGEWPFDGTPTAMVDIYNATTNTWNYTDLSVARAGIGAVSHNGKVYFAGGYHPLANGELTHSSVIDIYDTHSNTWTTSQLSQARSWLSAASLGNKIYFGGGNLGLFPSTPTNRIDVYDASSNSWNQSSLSEPRTLARCISVGHNVFWAGGLKPGLSGAWELSNSIEIFNTQTSSFNLMCMIPRREAYPVIVNDMVIFFTSDGNDPRNSTEFEIYNTRSGTWYTGKLSQPIYNPSAVSLNNTVYVLGETIGPSNQVSHVWKLQF